jgi:hypothetical protein
MIYYFWIWKRLKTGFLDISYLKRSYPKLWNELSGYQYFLKLFESSANWLFTQAKKHFALPEKCKVFINIYVLLPYRSVKIFIQTIGIK